MVFPHVMYAQRADHVTSRVCGHIWVTCILRFCVQFSSTYIDTLLPSISL